MKPETNRKNIGNVNVLDLRHATEASVAGIERIGNVNLVIQTANTAPHFQQLEVGNVNVVVTVPEDADVHQVMGLSELTGASLEEVSSPIYLLVVGKLLVHPDVTVEAISNRIAGIVVFGKLVCPQPLMGAIQGKLERISGKTTVYPVLDRVELRSLTLDEGYLNSLPDGTKLSVAGSLDIPEVLSNDLITQKIAVLHVSSSGLCHEENHAAVQHAMTLGGTSLAVIPAGHRFVEQPLVLDRAHLSALRDPFLYNTEQIILANDVPADLVNEKIKGLRSEEIIVCPEELESVIVEKLDVLKDRVIFYKGELLLVDGEEILRSDRLAAYDRPVTLLVKGALGLAKDLTAEQITSRIARVHNLGRIACSSGQIGAIESLLGIRDGELVVDAEEAPSKNWIGNVNMLEL
ncbi:hypothetical protein JW848_06805 [Candidatus Bipolaricaulota bacterium]|nr:hypothetical protein [Candidatus Bipolaricaulota bacterium]